jgi:uncharacterized protein
VIVPDVNVLVYAHRADTLEHEAARTLLERELGAGRPVGLADTVVTGFLRIVTHPRIPRTPTPLASALAVVDALLAEPSASFLRPRIDHWPLLKALCREADARGNLVPDAHLAALAISWNGELVSADRGFARFPGLRFRPLNG